MPAVLTSASAQEANVVAADSSGEVALFLEFQICLSGGGENSGTYKRLSKQEPEQLFQNKY